MASPRRHWHDSTRAGMRFTRRTAARRWKASQYHTTGRAGRETEPCEQRRHPFPHDPVMRISMSAGGAMAGGAPVGWSFSGRSLRMGAGAAVAGHAAWKKTFGDEVISRIFFNDLCETLTPRSAARIVLVRATTPRRSQPHIHEPGTVVHGPLTDRAAFDPWSVAADAGGVWVSHGSSRVYRIDPQSLGSRERRTSAPRSTGSLAPGTRCGRSAVARQPSRGLIRNRNGDGTHPDRQSSGT